MLQYLNPIARFLNQRIGFIFPRRLRQAIYWRMNPPDPRKRIDLVFDIVGSCNLKCPSCPVGNMGAINPAGKMDLNTYERILDKANSEYAVQNVVLYNWAEVILHPQLPEFVSLAKSKGLPVSLSSNLNILRRVDDILNAKPDGIRISLSGFTQEVYGITHKGGDIEKVKENMRILSEAKKRLGNTETVISVYFHKYKHNLHEVEKMKAYSEELGFSFGETWAYLMPYEKAADYMEGKLPADETLFAETQFALPIRKAIQAAQKYKEEPCVLLENQIVLDLKGNLLLCCTVYDYDKNRLGSFLDMTPEQVLKAKENNASCERCSSHGLHKYFVYDGDPRLKTTYEALVEESLSNFSKHALREGLPEVDLINHP